MIKNKDIFLSVVKKDFPEFIDDNAILDDVLYQLSINASSIVELSIYRNSKRFIKLYSFINKGDYYEYES